MKKPKPERCKFQIRRHCWNKGKWNYHWRFVASNGQIIAGSAHNYTRKENCIHAIKLINSYCFENHMGLEIEDLTK